MSVLFDPMDADENTMKLATLFGLAGDTLTFVGGVILALDALRRKKESQRAKDLKKTVELLAGVKLTKDNITLVDSESVELVSIQLSVRRAFWGAIIVTSGFLCLLIARIIESAGRP